jgi:4-hydroxybenzoate polyprenyltransferase
VAETVAETMTIAGQFSGDGAAAVDREASSRALCVDLDGTLVKCDTLVDSLLVLARQKPSALLRVPGWILGGKANLKAHLGQLVTLDAAHLPYNKPLITWLEKERAAGRRIYLTTGADTQLAEAIASHIGLFDEVLASDGTVNLTGRDKLASLESRFGLAAQGPGFDYIGNARSDIVLLEHAGEAMVANPDANLRAAIHAHRFPVVRLFQDQAPLLRSLRKAIRLHQWAKNSLVFLPMLLAHSIRFEEVRASVMAFFAFSFCASGTYILNDLLDIEADRRHPKKRFRPFAAADLSAKYGVLLSSGLLLGALLLALALPSRFLVYLALYLVTTVSYSFYFKRVVLVDVLLLSGLYTLRLLAGSSATRTDISPWLAGFSVFLFLSLAMVKRFSELKNMLAAGQTPSNGRGYLLADTEQIRSFGTASAYASVVVFSMYISGRDVAMHYHHQDRMWLITPLMLLWLSRVWLLASRGEMDEDPVIFAVTDWVSLVLGAAVLGVALFAM